jgi:uncharacterized protein YjbI with pentapeptide repeats
LIIPLFVTGVIGFLFYRQISIQTAWKIVQETQGEKRDIRRHEALESLNFWGESMHNAPLDKANLSNIALPGAVLFKVNLSGANLMITNFSDANLIGANLMIANLRRANFSDANLIGANLIGADFSGAFLIGANFSYTNLIGANLIGANLRRANLIGANLIGANLYGADLLGAKNLTNSQIKNACFWDQAIYKGHSDEKTSLWTTDEPANRQYIEQLKKDKSSDPETPPDCSNW